MILFRAALFALFIRQHAADISVPIPAVDVETLATLIKNVNKDNQERHKFSLNNINLVNDKNALPTVVKLLKKNMKANIADAVNPHKDEHSVRIHVIKNHHVLDQYKKNLRTAYLSTSSSESSDYDSSLDQFLRRNAVFRLDSSPDIIDVEKPSPKLGNGEIIENYYMRNSKEHDKNPYLKNDANGDDKQKMVVSFNDNGREDKRNDNKHKDEINGDGQQNIWDVFTEISHSWLNDDDNDDKNKNINKKSSKNDNNNDDFKKKNSDYDDYKAKDKDNDNYSKKDSYNNDNKNKANYNKRFKKKDNDYNDNYKKKDYDYNDEYKKKDDHKNKDSFNDGLKKKDYDYNDDYKKKDIYKKNEDYNDDYKKKDSYKKNDDYNDDYKKKDNYKKNDDYNDDYKKKDSYKKNDDYNDDYTKKDRYKKINDYNDDYKKKTSHKKKDKDYDYDYTDKKKEQNHSKKKERFKETPQEFRVGPNQKKNEDETKSIKKGSHKKKWQSVEDNYKKQDGVGNWDKKQKAKDLDEYPTDSKKKVRIEGNAKPYISRNYDYYNNPKPKMEKPAGKGFGRTSIPFVGKRGIYEDK